MSAPQIPTGPTPDPPAQPRPGEPTMHLLESAPHSAPTPEPLAELIMRRALRDGRCGEAIDAWRTGGTVRINEKNGRLRITQGARDPAASPPTGH